MVMTYFKKNNFGVPGCLIEPLTLDFDSGHDLRVSSVSALAVEPASDLTPLPPPEHNTLSLK